VTAFNRTAYGTLARLSQSWLLRIVRDGWYSAVLQWSYGGMGIGSGGWGTATLKAGYRGICNYERLDEVDQRTLLYFHVLCRGRFIWRQLYHSAQHSLSLCLTFKKRTD